MPVVNDPAFPCPDPPGPLGRATGWQTTLFRRVVTSLTITCATFLCLASPCSAAPTTREAEPLRVLFVGNSYTSVNDLPGTFAKVARSAGHAAPSVDSITPGGKTLSQHLADPKTLAKIDEGFGPRHLPWDVVILQEQSQTPAFAEVSERHRREFLAGAVGLYDRVKQASPATRVVFYQTWARHADAWKANDVGPLGKGPPDMQARLRKWYAFAADEEIPKRSAAARNSDATVAPIGDAWEGFYKEPGALRLHGPDHSHPSVAGTYLAALVLRRSIYDAPGNAVPKVNFDGSLPPADAARLKRIAATSAGVQTSTTTAPTTRNTGA